MEPWVHKVYDTPRTPYRRLLEHGVLTPEQREKLAQEHLQMNPIKLQRDFNRELERLWPGLKPHYNSILR